MALYEGIALIQEKQAVVLDLGSEYTKFGFTGEAAPRCIIPSEFWCPTERRYKRVFDFRSTEELYENLVHMLHLLYFRHVLVNPKERKVLVVESLFTTTQFRETLAKVLFMHYEVSGVTWWDSARLSTATLGAPIVLVVSIGAEDAEVVAVVHGVPVVHAMQSQPLGARAVRAELERLLHEQHQRDASDQPPVELTPQELEDIVLRTCFVPGRELAPRLASENYASVRGVDYPRAGGGGTVWVGGAARAAAAEPLFARDHEMDSLPDAVLQCIRMCPIDTRRALAESVLVTGGGAALPGLRARLAHELRHLVTQPPYKHRLQISTFKFHSWACEGNACAWAGGALVGAADGGARALPRDAFLRASRLPDWAALASRPARPSQP